MPDWNAPLRPAEYAEQSLITAILNGDFPPGSSLPGERELAARLGLTRPTLREALQRLARDGWVTIHQGKPTLVNDIWREGGLNILSDLIRFNHLPADFTPYLLEVRLVLAPAYTSGAIHHDPETIVTYLHTAIHLEDDAAAFTRYDWQLHRRLTLASGNPVYPLILNGFATLYETMALTYFSRAEARAVSRQFYAELCHAFEQRDAHAAESITRRVMAQSLQLWREAQ